MGIINHFNWISRFLPENFRIVNFSRKSTLVCHPGPTSPAPVASRIYPDFFKKRPKKFLQKGDIVGTSSFSIFHPRVTLSRFLPENFRIFAIKVLTKGRFTSLWSILLLEVLRLERLRDSPTKLSVQSIWRVFLKFCFSQQTLFCFDRSSAPKIP